MRSLALVCEHFLALGGGRQVRSLPHRPAGDSLSLAAVFGESKALQGWLFSGRSGAWRLLAWLELESVPRRLSVSRALRLLVPCLNIIDLLGKDLVRYIRRFLRHDDTMAGTGADFPCTVYLNRIVFADWTFR